MEFCLEGSFTWLSLEVHVVLAAWALFRLYWGWLCLPSIALDSTLLSFSDCSQMGPSCFPVILSWLVGGFPVFRSGTPISLFPPAQALIQHSSCGCGCLLSPICIFSPWRDFATWLCCKCCPWIFWFCHLVFLWEFGEIKKLVLPLPLWLWLSW